MFIRRLIVPALIVAAALLAGCTDPLEPAGAQQRPPRPGQGNQAPLTGQALIDRGRQVFQAQCQTCHGPEGRGDGPAAYLLFPKPRDFTTGTFRLHSTATGDPPTDDDLFRTVTNGMPGSAMPSFGFLTEQDRRAVVAVIKTFAPDVFEWQADARVIEPGTAPPESPALTQLGRQVYSRMGCANCHGESGRGDGPAVGTQHDNQGNPAFPNDLTRGIYKGGSDPRDIYLRYTTGMSGSPMPSFELNTTDEERWALAYYVRSLAHDFQRYNTGIVIRAARVGNGEAPTDPRSPVWNRVEPAHIPLMVLWQRPVYAGAVDVEAVHDGGRLSIRLAFDDPSVDGRAVRVQEFADGAAIQFGLTDPAGHISMGEPSRPVAIWHWRFDRQIDVASWQDQENAYPAMMAPDDYPFEVGAPPRPEQPPITAGPSHDPTYITGWGAGNPVSNPNIGTPVQVLSAEGFGTLEALPAASQTVTGVGVWRSGRWYVTFTRTLRPATSSDQEAGFHSGGSIPIAFAVWDGGARDRDGQKAASMWQVLRLER